MDSLETLGQLIRISERGISMLRGVPQAVKVLADIEGKSEDPDELAKLKQVESDAARAKSEVDADFPLLHSLAVVAIWSILEHFVKGTVRLWFIHRADALAVPPVQKLKIRLGEYLQLSRREQAYHLVELLEQDLASPLKRGASRFESILEPFGLSGAVEVECSKRLFELQQVRNVIVHQNGIADRRLKKECPWLRIGLGKPVRISHKALDEYFGASIKYALEVFYRVGDIYGHDLRSARAPNKSLQRSAQP